MTPQEAIALFAAARAHGISRFKLGDLEVALDTSLPAHPRGTGRPKPKPVDSADLAMSLSRRPVQDVE